MPATFPFEHNPNTIDYLTKEGLAMAKPHVPTELLKKMGVPPKDISIANLKKAKQLIREGVKHYPSGRKK